MVVGEWKTAYGSEGIVDLDHPQNVEGRIINGKGMESTAIDFDR